jgi:hypothetical protein
MFNARTLGLLSFLVTPTIASVTMRRALEAFRKSSLPMNGRSIVWYRHIICNHVVGVHPKMPPLASIRSRVFSGRLFYSPNGSQTTTVGVVRYGMVRYGTVPDD